MILDVKSSDNIIFKNFRQPVVQLDINIINYFFCMRKCTKKLFTDIIKREKGIFSFNAKTKKSRKQLNHFLIKDK